jgi:galactokinase
LRPTGGNATVLGELMNKWHESLATLSVCQYGAIGSRLTGAGWGGCAVTIVPRMATSSMLKSIAHEYYGGEEDVESIEKGGILLFVSKPCAGASRMII